MRRHFEIRSSNLKDNVYGHYRRIRIRVAYALWNFDHNKKKTPERQRGWTIFWLPSSRKTERKKAYGTDFVDWLHFCCMIHQIQFTHFMQSQQICNMLSFGISSNLKEVRVKSHVPYLRILPVNKCKESLCKSEKSENEFTRTNMNGRTIHYSVCNTLHIEFLIQFIAKYWLSISSKNSPRCQIPI